jgi:hypothetical protein
MHDHRIIARMDQVVLTLSVLDARMSERGRPTPARAPTRLLRG